MDQVFDRIEAALPAGCEAVVADLYRQIEEYEARPPRPLGDGREVKDHHGIIEWVWALQDGWADLPDVIPAAVLLAWRNGHANHPAKASPLPFQRCQGCRMALPNATPDGHGNRWAACPVCGSDRIAHQSLGHPWGSVWTEYDENMQPRTGRGR